MIRNNSARRSPKRGPAKKQASGAHASPPRRRPTLADNAHPERNAQAAPAPSLNPKQLRELRARAHALEPIVQVGHGGISEAVVRAVSRALFDHELIKVRLHEPEDKRAMAAQLATAARAALCGLVGHTLILYRPKPKQKRVSGVARSAIKRNQPKRGRP